MSIATEYQVITSVTGKTFYVGMPIKTGLRAAHQNIIDAGLMGTTLEDFETWMIDSGAHPITKNEETGFVLFGFNEKKKASKVAKTLTKAYLRYWMAQREKNG